MPTLEDKVNDTESPLLLRELFYGAPKTRKTWLAGTAAEAGFNVILLDCDHGYHILAKQLSSEARKRLQLFECRDSVTKANACEFLTRFLSNQRVFFNNKTRLVVPAQPKEENPDISELNISRHLDKNTVLILDSYTALIASLWFRYAIENKINLMDPVKEDDVRPGYAWAGALASTLLEKLTKLPCHVIVTGHETMYEKYKKIPGSKKQELEWTRRQIKSTSNPHSMTIGDKFSDILYFYTVSSISTKIDTRPAKLAEGGSRIIPPNAYNWEDLVWEKICGLAGIQLPPKDLPYLDFTPDITTTGGSPDALIKTISTNPKLTNVKGLEKKIPDKKTTPIIIKK